jgi:hypothetical protein
MMKMNVGTWDRLARIVIGIAAISLAFWGPRTAWGWLGLIPLATGLARRCPAYGVCGISTTKGFGFSICLLMGILGRI